MRTKDTTHLQSLGPYAVAMFWILLGAEENREDKLTPGNYMKDDSYNIGSMRGCFPLFRGGSMRPEWLDTYNQSIGNGFRFKGQASCSLNLHIALNFAYDGLAKDQLRVPVLFIYAIVNYSDYGGVRMNNEGFSAYPYEEEILMKDGCDVYVLAINEKEITNINEDFTKYDEKTSLLSDQYFKSDNKNVKIIYLLHRGY